MSDHNPFTKALAAVGTVIIWIPILAPLFLGMIKFFQSFLFLFDYLMPAELFPVAIVGAAMLLWAAFRARSKRKWIAIGIGVAAVSLASSQMLAVATGLASGAIPATGIWSILCVLLLFVYTIAVVAIGIAGILLLRELYTKDNP